MGSLWLAIAICSGCSKQSADSNAAASPNGGSGIPFSLKLVKPAETSEGRSINVEVKELFAQQRFLEIEVIANKYRNAQNAAPDGNGDIGRVYAGFVVSDSSPDEVWIRQIDQLKEWIRRSPKSITPRVALAQTWLDFAWKARGRGYANTVTDQGWRLFEARLNESVSVLKQAEKLQEKCPVWWSRMMRAALGVGMKRADFDKLFQTAIKTFPDYAYYYSARAIYLLPRWHGSPGEWEADLKRSADKAGGTAGDLLYARVVWQLHGWHSNIFRDTQINWDRTDRGFAEMEKQFPGNLTAKSMRAYMAVMGADAATARKLVEQLNGEVDLTVWDSEDRFRKLVVPLYSK